MTQAPQKFDLLLKGGTLLDPGQGIHLLRDVAFSGGRVAEVAEHIAGDLALDVLDAKGKLVTPGLIDVHGHYYHGNGALSVDARRSALPAGVTTVVDAGSAGWANYGALRDYVAPASGLRMLAFLHIGAIGLVTSQVLKGELHDTRVIDVDRTAQHVLDNPGFAVGVKVRMFINSIAYWDAQQVLRQARAAADQSKTRLMVHVSNPPIPLPEILDVMGSGDVVTHVYNGNQEHILDAQGKVRPEVRAAMDRGVVMDVAHAGIHCDIGIVREALAQGFPPTTISTDIHHGPAERVLYQLNDLIGKFVALGLSLDDAVAATTASPAQILGLADEIGSLRVGMAGDAAVFDRDEGDHTWQDAAGNMVKGSLKLHTFATVRDGAVLWRRPE
ncbi:MAG: dihydroorotase [Chloroflexi bacterium]|jgi:dihydroorotase|nr:MAG: dihydroorotase [Chloroflexota bacterium]